VTARGVGAWLVLAGVLVALDGAVGGAVAVAIGAVALAELPRRILAIGGTVALAAVPVAVLARGLPSEEEVSPAFVVGSLVPHHLTFAGLVLVGTWAVLDVRAHGVRRPLAAGPDPATVSPSAGHEAGAGASTGLPLGMGLAIVGLVAVGAIAACAAVLGA
jgi:hypothetical protein